VPRTRTAVQSQERSPVSVPYDLAPDGEAVLDLDPPLAAAQHDARLPVGRLCAHSPTETILPCPTVRERRLQDDPRYDPRSAARTHSSGGRPLEPHRVR
jgi:hypothetical protein